MSESERVVVVGSGAAGAWMAKGLTERGIPVTLLEAGKLLCPAVEALPYRTRRARQPVQSLCYAYGPDTYQYFVDDCDHPYETPPEKSFTWIRNRVVGGRMRLWARFCLRFAEADFANWPITLADLIPYYDEVESFLRVTDMPLAPTEERLQQILAAHYTDRRLIPGRMAQRGIEAVLHAAAATGRLDLRPNSVVLQVLTDTAGGRARALVVRDILTGETFELPARAIVLCASTIETTRLLLSSTNPHHPEGLGNTSGVLGHYLTDHISGVEITALDPHSAAPGEPFPYMLCSYIPCFERGFGCYVSVPRDDAIQSDALRIFRNRARTEGATPVNLWSFGEVQARYENQVTLGSARDMDGQLVPRIEMNYTQKEHDLAETQQRALLEMAEVAGLAIQDRTRAPATPGTSIHELGTARMGADRSNSFLNPLNQSWAIPNLYVTDGACFASAGCQNPTLTIMALSARTAHHLARELGRQAL